jgi:hypothetical protein
MDRCCIRRGDEIGTFVNLVPRHLDQAIQTALLHNHSLLAARTTVQQSEALEITANLRPNPTLFTDWEYLPLVHPNGSGILETSTTPPKATSA